MFKQSAATKKNVALEFKSEDESRRAIETIKKLREALKSYSDHTVNNSACQIKVRKLMWKVESTGIYLGDIKRVPPHLTVVD
ncbi:MAG: hypothetical protein HQL95_11645 [Magnetococcales bacterium]|nr:hypothetical protein [Magnetococcales bacterium]